MKVSDYIISFIAKRGVQHIFELSGGTITHLTDSVGRNGGIGTISMHHEQAAAFAAEGYARIRENGVGVAMATSGPGATNLMTGIASCFFDSIPCVFITGQVNTYEYKGDLKVRQMGFQETDIVKVVRPIVKEAFLINDPADIRYALERAFHTATTGRKGPVLLDIPMNIQRSLVEPAKLRAFKPPTKAKKGTRPSAGVEKELGRLLSKSRRPVFLLGGGVRLSGAQAGLAEIIGQSGIPVVASLMGLDAFPHDHPSYVGMIGSYGNRYANLALAASDLIIALGTRLDSRQIGTKPKSFARRAKLVHVDVDAAELNNKVRAALPVNLGLADFLPVLVLALRGLDLRDGIAPWVRHLDGLKAKYPSIGKIGAAIHPNHIMRELSGFLAPDTAVCVDVGQHQMWAAQSIVVGKAQRFMTQGGLAAMGSSLPMAIGASFADPGRLMAVVAGDGSFQLNIQELETLKSHQLPIKIIVINNRCYGMVRQFQKQYFYSKFYSTVLGYSAPDFRAIAKAYGIPARRISATREMAQGLKWLFTGGKPALLEVMVDRDLDVIPKLGVNMPIEAQEPLISKSELKSAMNVKGERGKGAKRP